jgi:hypothetical protein
MCAKEPMRRRCIDSAARYQSVLLYSTICSSLTSHTYIYFTHSELAQCTVCHGAKKQEGKLIFNHYYVLNGAYRKEELKIFDRYSWTRFSPHPTSFLFIKIKVLWTLKCHCCLLHPPDNFRRGFVTAGAGGGVGGGLNDLCVVRLFAGIFSITHSLCFPWKCNGSRLSQKKCLYFTDCFFSRNEFTVSYKINIGEILKRLILSLPLKRVPRYSK